MRRCTPSAIFRLANLPPALLNMAAMGLVIQAISQAQLLDPVEQAMLIGEGLGSWVAIVAFVASFLCLSGAASHSGAVLFVVVMDTLCCFLQIGLGSQTLVAASSDPRPLWLTALAQAPTNVSSVQHVLGCCGFNSLADFPFLPCPVNATVPCGPFFVAAHTVGTSAGATQLASGLVLLLVIGVSLHFLRRVSREEQRPLSERIHQPARATPFSE